MSEKFVTKRPHKKSRAGCQTCKTRKIKCDEVQPACGFCTTRKLPCDYTRVPRSQLPSPSSDSTELVVRSIGLLTPSEDEQEDSPEAGPELILSSMTMPTLTSLTSNDLRLMHHWSTSTWKSIGVGSHIMDEVFRSVLPGLAFENEFLLNALLGISSLHQQRMLPDPNQARRQTDIYRAKAFRGFREILPTLDTTSETYEAALLMAIMLLILCSKDYSDEGDLTIINWLVLYRGLSALLNLTPHKSVMESRVAPVFQRQLSILYTPPAVPTILIDMVKSIKPTDLDFEGLRCYCESLDAMGNLYASLRDDGLSGPLFVRIVSWPTYLSDVFAKFARERRPRALIILAYHLAFLKLVKGTWWVQGISDPEIYIISQLVGPDLLPYMDIPLQVRNMSDDNDIVALLLR